MGKKFESLVECHYSDKLNKEGRMQPMTEAKAKAIDTIYKIFRKLLAYLKNFYRQAFHMQQSIFLWSYLIDLYLMQDRFQSWCLL